MKLPISPSFTHAHALYILYNPHTNTIFSEVVCFCLPVRSLGSQTRLRGHRVSSTVESWQRLLPVVECEEDGMTLTVRRRRAAQLLLDRGDATPSACLCAPVAWILYLHYIAVFLFFFFFFLRFLLGNPNSFLILVKLRFCVVYLCPSEWIIGASVPATTTVWLYSSDHMERPPFDGSILRLSCHSKGACVCVLHLDFNFLRFLKKNLKQFL